MKKTQDLRYFLLILLAAFAMLFVATPAYAQCGSLSNCIYGFVLDVLVPLVTFLIGLAVVIFLYGMVKFMAGAGNEADRSKGKQVMIWGIVGLFVIVSVWAFVAIFASTLGFSTGTPAPSIPALI